MLFNSVDFLLFFPVVTVLYFLLPHKIRWVWLLAASYYFYMCWNPKYAVLIAFSTLVTYLSGLLIARTNRLPEGTKRKRLRVLWVALSFGINLAILFFFKYWGFFTANLEAAFGLFGVSFRAPAFDVILPVGISFYTFQALSYTMDVYRGELDAEPNFFKYALFVSFFPQLVAGPIERSKNLLLQVHEKHTFDPERVRNGLLLMLWGMFQKIVIADRVAYVVSHVYSRWDTMPGAAIVMATMLFAVQIYCDFAGYSDIAIGAAQVLGFRLMDNFRQPYLAKSAAEFWRRWHISLSTWFRDYLYIPLGGSRCKPWRKYLNVMITFLTSGLWHGASWNYVAWGGLNGAYQVAGAMLAPTRQKLCKSLHIDRERPFWRAARCVWTFLLIDFAWLFFRAPSFRTALAMVKRTILHFDFAAITGEALWTFGLAKPHFIVMLFAIAVLILADFLKERGPVMPKITKLPLIPRWAFYIMTIVVILTFGMYGPGFSESQFIYFQF